MKAPRFQLADAILYQDEDYLFVHKPAHISTLEDRNDAVNMLAVVRQAEPDAQVCHRLDKDTSGVLAIARHPEAYRHLSMQFEHRQVKKIYHALVDGLHQFQQTEVDKPILKLPDGMVRIAREGKPAHTFFTTLRSFRQHTLVECQPVTGRMHQIRIHLATLGASIAGDEQYGGKPVFLSAIKRDFKLKKETEEEPLMKRMALHAFSLEFDSMQGQRLRVEAPYPKDLRALIKQLEAHSR